MILQTMGCHMGVEADRSPKCHPDLAGEGIEHTWAHCKNHFCNILLDRKRGRKILSFVLVKDYYEKY